jgi:predicted phosphodiesterase
MRIAVLSDIHGNADALAAVMEDLFRQSPDLTVNLGD